MAVCEIEGEKPLLVEDPRVLLAIRILGVKVLRRLVRFYTPLNEIFIAATFSAQFGWWNERLATDHAFVTALKHRSSSICRAWFEWRP